MTGTKPFIALLSRAGRALGLLRRISRRQIIGVLASGAFFWGAGDGRPHVAMGAAHRPKPWFDAKGAFVFPLAEGALPATREQFNHSLTQAWKAHLRFPEGGDIIQTEGGRYPALGSLLIQLSGGIVDTKREAENNDPPLKPSGKVEGRVAVRQFDLDAQPLITDKAKMSVHIAATDARLDIEHDEHGRPMMMLADATEASFQFEATNADMEKMLVQDLTLAGKKYGVKVKKATLKLTAVNNRSIDVDLHLSTVVAFVPAGMRFEAHVEIDNDMYARLSHLKCEGDEALGPLISGLIRPGLAKYEGKSRPVFSFPTGQLKLKDVTIQGGDDVKIGAKFSR
jgi:hypothetical protein